MSQKYVYRRYTGGDGSEAHLKEKKETLEYQHSFVRQPYNETKKIMSSDFQKVLSTPKSTSMLVGFSRKLTVYNGTIFESGSKKSILLLLE